MEEQGPGGGGDAERPSSRQTGEEDRGEDGDVHPPDEAPPEEQAVHRDEGHAERGGEERSSVAPREPPRQRQDEDAGRERDEAHRREGRAEEREGSHEEDRVARRQPHGAPVHAGDRSGERRRRRGAVGQERDRGLREEGLVRPGRRVPEPEPGRADAEPAERDAERRDGEGSPDDGPAVSAS
jgi:hypothetical protein